MMMSEFIERTNYTPEEDEYRFIEESYYDCNDDKDIFCKAWLKDKKSGAWDKELKLRKRLLETESKYADELDAEKKAWEAKENALRKQQDELEAKNAELEAKLVSASQYVSKKVDEIIALEDALNGAKRNVKIVLKDGTEKAYYTFKEFRFKDADGFRFFTEVEENGFASSFRLDEVASVEIAR